MNNGPSHKINQNPLVELHLDETAVCNLRKPLIISLSFRPEGTYGSLTVTNFGATSFADRLFNVKITLYILISFLGQFGTTFPELFLNNISKTVKLIPGFITVFANREPVFLNQPSHRVDVEHLDFFTVVIGTDGGLL
ncbi:unnamed protein product [Leuciscus chuanchicus]